MGVKIRIAVRSMIHIGANSSEIWIPVKPGLMDAMITLP